LPPPFLFHLSYIQRALRTKGGANRSLVNTYIYNRSPTVALSLTFYLFWPEDPPFLAFVSGVVLRLTTTFFNHNVLQPLSSLMSASRTSL
jgi:hypothetical protein